MDSAQDPFEIFRTTLLAAEKSRVTIAKVLHEFFELDFATIYQQYADVISKSVDKLTDGEKKQAVLNAVLSND